jgi:uncharacterized protein with PIN domain
MQVHCVQMAILNLDKIILRRTISGVACPVCGGLLEVLLKEPGWLRKMIRKKENKKVRYRCKDCRRRYKMEEVL